MILRPPRATRTDTRFPYPTRCRAGTSPGALACGNTFVMKPSEKVPSAMLRIAELAKEAGVPDGVLNVVNGGREAVDALLGDPRVASISFVGSEPVARYVYTTGTAHGKRVQALAGAKHQMVVMPAADLELATDGLMGAAYGSAGERCMAGGKSVVQGKRGSG